MYRMKALLCFALALLPCWLANNPSDEPYPLWLVGLLACGAAALALQGVRHLRLHHYYEGRRTRLVIDARRPGGRRH
jgi:hypothetical protein